MVVPVALLVLGQRLRKLTKWIEESLEQLGKPLCYESYCYVLSFQSSL